jgi:hypothetical protein
MAKVNPVSSSKQNELENLPGDSSTKMDASSMYSLENGEESKSLVDLYRGLRILTSFRSW